MLGLDRGSNPPRPGRYKPQDSLLWQYRYDFADFRAGALRLGEGGGSDAAGSRSGERAEPDATAATEAAAVLVGVDLDSGMALESGAAVSALAP